MVEDYYDLREFRNLCRLFPLPGVVLFPHAILPLHIFEPRYRQMTADALASDRLIAIVRIPERAVGDMAGNPAIEPVACLGKILTHEPLPDARFNLLLVGLKRVRLVREVPSGKLYRMAEAELLEDEPTHDTQGPRRAELIALFRAVTERQAALSPELAEVLDHGLPLGPLTDVIAQALGLPAIEKQALLADCCVERRANRLIELLRRVTEPPGCPSRRGGGFPPTFSTN